MDAMVCGDSDEFADAHGAEGGDTRYLLSAVVGEITEPLQRPA